MSQSEGVIRLISLDGVAAGLTLDLATESGCDWVIIWAYGYHDDNAGAHAINWRFVDSNPIVTGTPVTINFPAAAALALNLNHGIDCWRPDVSVANMTHEPEPIVLTKYVKAVLVADAMGAAKKLYIRAMVREIGGMGT